MALNKSTGNMYAFVSHTYNPMKGECEHSCAYCFMRRKLLLPPLRLELKELKVNLGEGNFIFVGSSTDEWATNVPSEWIEQVLDYCDGFNEGIRLKDYISMLCCFRIVAILHTSRPYGLFIELNAFLVDISKDHGSQ